MALIYFDSLYIGKITVTNILFNQLNYIFTNQLNYRFTDELNKFNNNIIKFVNFLDNDFRTIQGRMNINAYNDFIEKIINMKVDNDLVSMFLNSIQQHGNQPEPQQNRQPPNFDNEPQQNNYIDEEEKRIRDRLIFLNNMRQKLLDANIL